MKKFARKMLSTFVTGMLVCGMAAGAPVASVYADEGETEDDIEISTVSDAEEIEMDFEETIYETYDGDVENKIPIDEEHFQDGAFRDYVTQFDLDEDGSLSDDEIKVVETISVNGREIRSLSGIDYFYNLKYLYCSGNQIRILDVSGNKLLETLHCERNQLISLGVSGNTNLKELWCGSNQLRALIVSNNTALQILYCDSNALMKGINLSANVNLVSFDCSYCSFESLNLGYNTKLVYLYCNDCNISELDLSNNTKLKEAFCSYNSNLKSLNCSNLSELYYLEVENDPNLEKLACLNTDISYLSILNNNKLSDVVDGKNYDIDQGYSTFLYEGPIRTNYEGKNELCYRKCKKSATYDQDKSYDACIDTSLNDFIHIEYYDGDDFWYYFKNGRVDNDFTGPASGTVDGVKAWYYVRNGKVNFEFKDFAKVGSSWMYFSNGKVDKSINADHYGSFWGTIDGKGGWYVVKAGKAYPNYNGFALVGSSWMQYKDGKIDKSYTGTLNVNINGTKKWYYINKGKAILDYTGFGKVGSSWMRFKNGSIDKTVTGIVTGTVNGEKAQWYVKSGKVQLDYSGTYTKNGKTYTIKNGKVTKVS